MFRLHHITNLIDIKRRSHHVRKEICIENAVIAQTIELGVLRQNRIMCNAEYPTTKNTKCFKNSEIL